MSITDWLEEATPDRREIVVCFDRRLVSALTTAQRDLKAARDDEDAPERMLGDSDPLADRVADLEAQVAAKSRTLAFEGLGWGRWRDLMSKHAPNKDQAQTFERAVRLGFMPHAVMNVGYDAETFIPAAIAATCVEPGMTVAEARQILDTSPPGVIDRIWTAVLDANLAGGDDPFVLPQT